MHASRVALIINYQFLIIARPAVYKSYDDEQLRKAYLAVTNDKVSIRRAAEMYNIPKSTLQDRLTGHVAFGSRSGPDCYLTDEEEKELVSFIERCPSLKVAL